MGLAKLLLAVGKWLETRFPEKVLITIEDLRNLSINTANAANDIKTLTARIVGVEETVNGLQTNSAHVGAVRDLMTVVAGLKEELTSLKFGLGMSKTQRPEIMAVLNGEPVADAAS